MIGKQVPGGFLPEEDQGYLYAGVQLPERRLAAAHRRGLPARSRRSSWRRPGVQYCTTVAGFSLLSRRDEHLQRLLLRHPEALGRAQEPGGAVRGHHGAASTGAWAGMPQGVAFAFSPPAIPGVGTSGGVTFILEDRAGKDIAFLAENIAEVHGRGAKSGRRSPG